MFETFTINNICAKWNLLRLLLEIFSKYIPIITETGDVVKLRISISRFENCHDFLDTVRMLK